MISNEGFIYGFMAYVSHAKLMFRCSQILPPGANMQSKKIQANCLHPLRGFSQVRSVTSHGSAIASWICNEIERIWKRGKVAAKLIKHLWSPLITFDHGFKGWSLRLSDRLQARQRSSSATMQQRLSTAFSLDPIYDAEMCINMLWYKYYLTFNL